MSCLPSSDTRSDIKGQGATLFYPAVLFRCRSLLISAQVDTYSTGQVNVAQASVTQVSVAQVGMAQDCPDQVGTWLDLVPINFSHAPASSI